MKKRRLLATEDGHLFASLRGSLVKAMAFLAVCLLTIGSSLAQTQTITGVVTEADGVTPVIGANVMVEGTLNGTVTGANGEFSLTRVAPGAALEITFVGYNAVSVNAVPNTTMNIKLEQDTQRLEDVVVVGYATVKKENLTGAISNIKGSDITTTQSSSLAQALQGKVAGFNIRQDSGQPGSTDTQINIRGFGSPIYVIDGVKRGDASDFQRLNANDIESISVLKDASAAIYGIGAQNGVVIVTTKKGETGRPKLSYTGVFGVMKATSMPRYLNGGEYAEVRNDSFINVGQGAPFTPQEVADLYSGATPSYDWWEGSMRDVATQTQHDISISGGNEVTRYFISASYQRETSMLRSKDEKFEKYTFRSNLSTKIGKDVTAELNISGRYDKKQEPGEDFTQTVKQSVQALPTTFPYANNNPDYPSDMVTGLGANPVVHSQKRFAGFREQYRKRLTTSMVLTWEVPWVEGLSAKAMGSYDHSSDNDVSLGRKYNLYRYDADLDEYNQNGTYKTNNISNTMVDRNNINLQAQIAYERTFGGQHNVSGTLVYEQNRNLDRRLTGRREWAGLFTNPQINQADAANQTTGGSDGESKMMSLIGRAHYDFRSKYLLDFSFRYDGSYRYAPDERWGFFPVISGAWRISEENFIKNNVSWLSNLKIKTSWGQIGEDTGNAFDYIPAFSTANVGHFEFSNGNIIDGVKAPGMVNMAKTWITNTTTDIGIEVGLFNKVDIEFDVYQRVRTGIMATRAAAVPNTWGASLPQENLNSQITKGFDMNVTYFDRWGDWTFRASGNLNFARTMNLTKERAAFTSSYGKWKTGAGDSPDRWQDMDWGYGLNGRFTDFADIRTSIPQNGQWGNTGNGTVTGELPGNHKLYDANGDGIITDNDHTPMFWSGQPKFTYGISLGTSWKGFDLNLLFQGAAKYTFLYSGGDAYSVAFEYNGNSPAYFMDRWHLADPTQGVYNGTWVAGEWPPIRHKDYHNGYTRLYERRTSVWSRNSNYLRLKNIELGYSLPKRIVNNWKIDGVRFYFQAHNVFTIADDWVKLFDPEKTLDWSGFRYPLMRSFNFGVNVTF